MVRVSFKLSLVLFLLAGGQTSGGSIQQPDTQMVFQGRDSAGDDRRGEVQGSGSACEAAFCDDLDKDAERAQLVHDVNQKRFWTYWVTSSTTTWFSLAAQVRPTMRSTSSP